MALKCSWVPIEIHQLAFLFQGWIKGQAGPVLTELLKITGVQLAEGSLFRTMYYGGVLVGCISIGVTYNRVYGPYLVFGPLLALGVATMSTPWCTVYWVMVTIHFLTGACGGMLETGTRICPCLSISLLCMRSLNVT